MKVVGTKYRVVQYGQLRLAYSLYRD